MRLFRSTAPLSLLLVCWTLPASAQGFRLEPSRLVVEPPDWQHWKFPAATAVIDSLGVSPSRIPATTDAIRAAAVLAAGTDAAGAAAAIDGDPTTFWEPDIDEPRERWWLEIDLGRMVNATRVVLRFAEQVPGDPFYQFSVLVSDGSTAFSGSKALLYDRVGRSEQPNPTRQRFDFDLTPRRPADATFVGDPIRYVMVQLTDSRGGHAEELSAEAWDRLEPRQRGAIDHFRRETSGRLRPVDRAQYEALSADNRGPIRYYRREQPRLTEIEVWTAGENLGLGVLDREGRLQGFGGLGSEVLTVDGDFTTAWATPSAYANPVDDPNRNLFIDLGSTYWLERLQFLYGVTQASGPFPNYVMSVSDGTRAPDGSLVWTPVGAKGVGAFNVIGYVIGPDEVITEFQGIAFPPTRARYFRLDYLVQVFFGCAGLGCSASVREIQFYGVGFLPEVVLESPPVELGDRPRTLGPISWEAEVPDGARLEIRTRSGNQLDRQVRYFNNLGGEVTETQYRKLLSFQRGDSLVTFIPGSGWSSWSQIYEASGEPVSSPSPRRYVQLQAALLSGIPDQAVHLRRLEVGLDTPLAAQLTAELSPVRVEDTGRDTPFTLYLRPQFESGDPGFDQVLLAGPPGAALALTDVVSGSEGDLAAGALPRLSVEALPAGRDSLWFRLPQRFQTGQQLLAVRFSCRLYGAANVFAVAAGLTDTAGQVRWQQADGGEATALGEGRGLNVLAPFAEAIVREAEVRPRVLSPNGDGVNDAAVFAFSVFKIAAPKALFLEVYDLAGRRVLRVERPPSVPEGRQELLWDGRGDDGHPLPPGVYLSRFGLQVDAGGDRGAVVTRLVSVAY